MVIFSLLPEFWKFSCNWDKISESERSWFLGIFISKTLSFTIFSNFCLLYFSCCSLSCLIRNTPWSKRLVFNELTFAVESTYSSLLESLWGFCVIASYYIFISLRHIAHTFCSCFKSGNTLSIHDITLLKFFL